MPLGEQQWEFALQGKNGIMATIVRDSDDADEYAWSIGEAPLEMVANVEMGCHRLYRRRWTAHHPSVP